jgi:hypothetical protein
MGTPILPLVYMASGNRIASICTITSICSMTAQDRVVGRVMLAAAFVAMSGGR